MSSILTKLFLSFMIFQVVAEKEDVAKNVKAEKKANNKEDKEKTSNKQLVATLVFDANSENGTEELYYEDIVALLTRISPQFTSLKNSEKKAMVIRYVQAIYSQKLLAFLAATESKKKSYKVKYAKEYEKARSAILEKVDAETDMLMFFKEIENSIKDEEIKELYEKRKQEVRYRSNIIVIAYNTAKEAYSALNKVESFNSQSLSSLNAEANAFWITTDEMGQRFGIDFVRAVNGIMSGICLEPVKGLDGRFYLIQVIQKETIPMPEFSVIKDSLKQALVQKKIEELARANISMNSIQFSSEYSQNSAE